MDERPSDDAPSRSLLRNDMGKWYYLNTSLDKVGPISSTALKSLADNGVIDPLTTLISEDSSQMFEAGNVPGLFPETDPFASGIHEREIPLSLTPPKKNPSTGSSHIPSGGYDGQSSPPPILAEPSRSIVPPPLPIPPPIPGSPWDSAAVPPSAAWASGVLLPTTLQSVGIPVERVPTPSQQRTGTLFVFRPQFLIILLVLSVLLKIVRIGVALTPVSSVEVAAASKHREISRFFSEDLTAHSPAVVSVGGPKPNPSPRPPALTASNSSVSASPQPNTIPSGVSKPSDPRASGVRTPETRTPGTAATWFEEKEQDETAAAPSEPETTETMPTPVVEPEPLPTEDQEMFASPDASPLPTEKGRFADAEPPPPNKGSKNTEQIVAEVEGSIALILGENGSGSGFVVLPGVIATNSHVIGTENIKNLKISFPSESGSKKGPFSATLLYEDPDRDLAFLEISTKEHRVIPTVRDYRFRRGQKVIAIGNPGRGDGKVLENAVCEGILSTQTEVDDQPYYQLSIAINHGNSGGPVLDDAGNVLGVATLKATKTEAMAYCVPPDDLNLAIEMVRQTDSEQIRQCSGRHLSLVYLNRGLEKLAAIIQLPPSVLSDPPENLRELARSALKDLDEAVRRLPNDVRAYVARAVFKMMLDDWSGTVADLDKAVRLAPDKRELAEFRNAARMELEQRRQVAGGRSTSRTPINPITMQDMNRMRPPMIGPGLRPFGPRSFGPPIPRPSFLPPPVVGETDRGIQPIPAAEETEESLVRKRARYRVILAKEEWTFQGKPIYGTIVGYADGIVRLKPKDAAADTKPIERYANRFSPEDIEDIRFYAAFHGIPLENPRKR